MSLVAAGVDVSSFFERHELEAKWREVCAQAQEPPPPRAASSPASPQPQQRKPTGFGRAPADARTAPQAPQALCRDLARFFHSRGFESCCMPASIVLAELLSQRGVAATVRQGFLTVLGMPGFEQQAVACWHVWVESAGEVLDTGTAVTVCALAKVRGVSEEQAWAGLKHSYSAEPPPPPAALLADFLDEGTKVGLALKQAGWARFRQEDAEGTYWADCPPPVLALRAEAMRLFGRR